MNVTSRLSAALLFGSLVVGCASEPSYVVLLKDPDGATGKVEVRGAKGRQLIEKAGDGADLDGSKAPYAVDAAKLRNDFGAAMAARPSPPEQFLLYFESGGAKLTAESAALFPRIVEIARNRAAADVSIVGHSDTVGAADKNRQLALIRARSVAEQLQAGGLKALAISIESHGESNLLVKTPDETPEPRNRRVEITIR